jgi:hypothetical protein
VMRRARRLTTASQRRVGRFMGNDPPRIWGSGETVTRSTAGVKGCGLVALPSGDGTG